MCSARVPACVLNISPIRWLMPPTPCEPKLYAADSLRIASASSSSDFTGLLPLTATIPPTRASSDAGVKLRIGS